jgi:hypothetical protein
MYNIGDILRVKKSVKHLPVGFNTNDLVKIDSITIGKTVTFYRCYWRNNSSLLELSEDEVELVTLAVAESNQEAEVSSGGALRYNKGKSQFSHLSPDFIMEMMKGMTAANEKYPYLNYTKRQNVRTAADSLMRHFLKFQQGMDTDEELNTHHLALVAINAMIMYQNLQDFGDEVDDRYSKEKEKVQK